MSKGIGKIKQAILDFLPKPIARQLYLLRNSAYYAEGRVMDKIYMGLHVPKRNKLWIHRMESGEGHEYGICSFLENEVINSEDYIYCDVGSAFGFFPALLSEIKPKIQIYAFEAGWQQYYFLSKNQKNYAKKNKWVIENKYVGASNKGNYVMLDSYFKKIGKTPSLIQIDVDGFENEVLKGCQKIIRNKKTKFLLELHPLILHNYGTTIEEVLKHFDGYSIQVLADIREGNDLWSNDINLVYKDDNPYLYIVPN